MTFIIFSFFLISVIYANILLRIDSNWHLIEPRCPSDLDGVPEGISIIIAARNEEANLHWCLSSILDVEFDPQRYEIIIVDDHSSDCTYSIAAQFEQANVKRHPLLLAETAYPFSLLWEDWTNNIVGENGQLVSGYPATPEGQKNFLLKLREIMNKSSKGAGFCYWGTEWVSFKGDEATDGSSWENQALFDFNNKAVPALEAFAE